MVCNAAIHVLTTSLGVTIQGRWSLGRPSAKGSESSDVGDAKARDRMELEKEYKLPKVSDIMLLTHV